MRLTFFALFTALLAGCATTKPSDHSIDKLVAWLASTHGEWAYGTSPVIDLPATATPEQVLGRIFASSPPGLAITQYHVLTVREVTIPDSLYLSYTAVLADTNLGRRIVLLKYEGTPIGWWTRVYDPAQLAEETTK